MRQVLFEIPVKAIAGWFPEIPAFIYVVLAVLAVGAGSYAERRRQEGGGQGKVNFKIAGIVAGVLLGLIAVTKFAADKTESLPIFGYGAMLFVAFIVCTWLADRLATREGIVGVHVQDMAIWIFLLGIVGARLTYLFFADTEKADLTLLGKIGRFFRVWDGGLVFYGSAIGGLVGYFLSYFLILRKHAINSWKMADVIAPCAALGLCLGRFGCLLNGCCYGDVATCETCPGLGFPLASPPRSDMVARGHQTAAGFLVKDEIVRDSRGSYRENRRIEAVEPGSAAETAGLKKDDFIEKINGHIVLGPDEPLVKDDRDNIESGDLYALLHKHWPRGKNNLQLTVLGTRDGVEKKIELTIPARTLPLHPTQIYESVSMLLAFLLLLAYYPFRKQPGSVMVLFMFCYGVHRFLNEMLRTDTEKKAFDMTLSQNISVLLLVAAAILAVWLRIKTIRAQATTPPPLPPPPPALA